MAAEIPRIATKQPEGRVLAPRLGNEQRVLWAWTVTRAYWQQNCHWFKAHASGSMENPGREAVVLSHTEKDGQVFQYRLRFADGCELYANPSEIVKL